MTYLQRLRFASVVAALLLILLAFPLRSRALATLMMPGMALQVPQVNMKPECDTKAEWCGWELMQHQQIPISTLGSLYAHQTGDRTLCTLHHDGKEYCTCIFECGNGVWTCEEEGEKRKGGWRWERGCGKYCHRGVCDGQDEGGMEERIEV